MKPVIDAVVSEEEEGLRVDQWLTKRGEGIWSRTRLKKAIEEGCLTINETVVLQPRRVVKACDRIHFSLPVSLPLCLKPYEIPLEILGEDEFLLAVHKPAGMVVHLGNGVVPGTTLVEAVFAYCPLSMAGGPLRPGVVHRLDQATSGVILFAKTDVSYHQFTRMFAERRMHKTYHALVGSIPALQSGTIEAPIGRSFSDRTVMAVTMRGRPACTQWEQLEVFPQVHQALLACYPITGRTHQIRVHCKQMGMPIVGDTKYGKIPGERLFLHAYQLSFIHPFTYQKVCFTAPWPKIFREKIEALRKERGRIGKDVF